MSIQQVIAHIEKQVDNSPKFRIYVIEIESIPFKRFTKELQSYLESFTSLQYLSVNNCSLESLENFPRISSLIRLDLISNNLTNDFSHLKTSKYIQTLYLSANQITDYDALDSLKVLVNLLQLNLIANPLTTKADYSEQIFLRFPSLKFLDSKDKNGKTSDEANMSDSLQRIRPDLFVKGQSMQNLPSVQEIPAAKNKEFPAKKKEKKEIPTRKNENKEIQAKEKTKENSKTKIPGIKKTNSYKKAKRITRISEKVGLLFPVSRIRRKYKEKFECNRYSDKAFVFLTSVLQYMCAEILEVSGDQAKNDGVKRIMPRHLFKGIKLDNELKEFFENAIIPEAEFISKLHL